MRTRNINLTWDKLFIRIRGLFLFFLNYLEIRIEFIIFILCVLNSLFFFFITAKELIFLL